MNTDTLFADTLTPPPPLTIARAELARASTALCEAEQMADGQGPEAAPALCSARLGYARAREAVARAEAAEIEATRQTVRERRGD